MQHLLIIDNDMPQNFITILKSENFHLTCALDGKTGLEKAKEKPIMILLAQMLPDISGNEVLKLLKSDDITKNIPVVILSNLSDQERISEALDLGAIEYIIKYLVSAEDLAKKIRKIIPQE